MPRRPKDLRRWTRPCLADDLLAERERQGREGAAQPLAKNDSYQAVVPLPPAPPPCPVTKDGRHVVVMNKRLTRHFSFFWVCLGCHRGFDQYPSD